MAEILDETERRAVVTFLRVLSPGFVLYDQYCVGCHGADGQPLDSTILAVLGLDTPSPQEILPAFDQQYFQTHTTEQIRAMIRHMLTLSRVVMPHFAGDLTAEQVGQIVSYLRTLPPES
jgi:mono/diheme cytochrome c family protein